MGGATNLPPGFHFFPSDEDLVIHFLRRKAANLPCRPDIIPTVLLQHYNPWELNGLRSHPPTSLLFHGKHRVLITTNPPRHRAASWKPVVFLQPCSTNQDRTEWVLEPYCLLVLMKQ